MGIQDRDYMRRRNDEGNEADSRARMEQSTEAMVSKYGRWTVLVVVAVVIVTLIVLAATKPR